jgi:hypothetical protein
LQKAYFLFDSIKNKNLKTIIYFRTLLKKTTLIFFLFACIYTHAQNPVSRNITNQNGLPSNTVYNILQDKNGFIWMGHDKGLSRYDGNTFEHYIAQAQQGKSVSNLIEVNNSIWCQDFSGNFYYTKNDVLNKEPNFKTSGMYSPAGLINGHTIAVVNYDSLRTFDLKNQNKKYAAHLNEIKQAVWHEKNCNYFFSTNNLLKFDGNKLDTIFTHHTILPNFSFVIKIDNSFIGFTKIGFPNAYLIKENSIKPLSILKNGLLIQEVTIIENEIWVSTTSGAYCFNKNLQPLYNGHCFFEQNSITKIIKDREDNYWFGTLNKGVLFVPDINVRLYKYSTESITALSTYNNKNEVLAGTSSNLIFSFNSVSNKFNTIVSNETKGEVFYLYYDKANQTILSCANEVYYYKNGNVVKQESLAGKVITLLNNETYVAAFSGGISLLARNNTVKKYPTWLQKNIIEKDGKYFIEKDFRGRSVFFDTLTQTLYTATAKGLQYFNKEKNGSILINNKPIYASSLALINNVLYAGTYSDGLISVENFKPKQIKSNNNNVAASIYKLYADNNYLWIGSDELLQRYDIKTNNIINFTSADGLPKAEIKDVLVQNGKVYIATTDGLVIFSSNKNSINKVRPILQLNKFLVNETLKNYDSTYNFNPNENNIELFFSLLSFKDNAANTISYRINKEDWKSLPTGVRNLQLASLGPGKYAIEIKAINEDGIEAANTIFVNFTIASPFYKKFWFYALLSGIVLLGMFTYFKQRLNAEKKNNDLLAQKIELEHELHQSVLSSIKSQMNPHFIFNALNTIQSYIYTNEKENASLYLGKFSELTRTILDMSNKERISLAEEINALQLYIDLEQLRFDDKLNYTFEVDKNISTETVFIPSMLIQPYIENAIKHGLMHKKNEWQLSITFLKKINAVEVIVDDNGVGRKASDAINKQKFKKHKSFASGANQKRLEILNKGLNNASISLQIIDKQDNYGNAIGTTLILNIPFVSST